jgi:hypothetical protein
MTDAKTLRKQYATPKLKSMPLNKAKVFLQNQAAHGDAGAKEFLDLLSTPPKRNDPE